MPIYIKAGLWKEGIKSNKGELDLNNLILSLIPTSQAIWGSITGILSDQTDLNSALLGKQSTITFGTGVQSAIGNNLNSSGGLLSYNGLGTNWPSVLGATLGTGWSTALNATYTPGTGAPGGSTTQVQVNSSGSFIGYSNFTFDGNILNVNFSNNITIGKTAVFFGDSVTLGFGASIQSNRFSSLLCTYYGLIEVNFGAGGKKASDLVQADIPIYSSSTYQWLFMEYGINDLVANIGTSTYIANVTSNINAAIAKGWPPSLIIISNVPGCYIPGYPGGFHDATDYNSQLHSLCISLGTIYVDIYSQFLILNKYQATTTYPFSLTDLVHPNDAGYALIASLYKSVLKGNSSVTGNSFLSGGNTQVRNFSYINPTYLTSQTANILGVDSSNNVGIINGLPDLTTAFGRLYINGNIIANNAIIPTTNVGVTDIILAQGGAIRASYSQGATGYGEIIPFSLSGNVVLNTTITNGAILLQLGGTSYIRVFSTLVNVIPPTYFGGSFSTPNSTVQIGGSLAVGYVAKSANYNLFTTDFTVEVTGGTNSQTLPSAIGLKGRIYFITNSGSGVVTILTNSSQTFVNVSGTPTSLTLNQFQGVLLQSNDANWIKLSGF